jgi:hypothetical protein
LLLLVAGGAFLLGRGKAPELPRVAASSAASVSGLSAELGTAPSSTPPPSSTPLPAAIQPAVVQPTPLADAAAPALSAEPGAAQARGPAAAGQRVGGEKFGTPPVVPKAPVAGQKTSVNQGRDRGAGPVLPGTPSRNAPTDIGF